MSAQAYTEEEAKLAEVLLDYPTAIALFRALLDNPGVSGSALVLTAYHGHRRDMAKQIIAAAEFGLIEPIDSSQGLDWYKNRWRITTKGYRVWDLALMLRSVRDA